MIGDDDDVVVAIRILAEPRVMELVQLARNDAMNALTPLNAIALDVPGRYRHAHGSIPSADRVGTVAATQMMRQETRSGELLNSMMTAGSNNNTSVLSGTFYTLCFQNDRITSTDDAVTRPLPHTELRTDRDT